MAEGVQKLVDQGFGIKVRTLITVSENGTFSFKHGPLHKNPQKSGSGVDSCKGHDGVSVKDHREKGPICINNLLSLLIACRLEEVAYAGYILKMFNQVSVHLITKICDIFN